MARNGLTLRQRQWSQSTQLIFFLSLRRHRQAAAAHPDALIAINNVLLYTRYYWNY